MTNTSYQTYVANAMRWAQEQLGSERWPLRCLAFVEDAYEISNQIEMFGGSSAQESADLYGAADNGQVPPPGSFVFYAARGPGAEQIWGHVGLALEDGKIIHAWDRVRVDHYLAVQDLTPASGWSQPRYIGWVPVERILQGYRRKG